MINSLNVAQTGLAASKASVENVMNNIANANTEGYKKRVVETSELSHSDARLYGRGVSFDDIARISNQYMYDNIIKENSTGNNYQELADRLENIESIFKETDDSGFSADLDRYFQTIESLRANPNNEIYKNELRKDGQILVDDLKRLYADIEEEEALAKKAFNSNVDQINEITNDIATLNQQIKEQGFASNDLLDKRDLLEKELSDYVNISVDRNLEYYELKIGTEVVVRNARAKELTISEVYTPQLDRYVEFDESTRKNTSNILSKSDIFDEEDVITFELNNQASVSVEYGETMVFDLDGDGVDDTVNVDETNYIRALVEKINSSSEMSSVQAFNGEYSLDGSTKVTNDRNDNFLIVESKLPGVENKFDSRITFVEEGYAEVVTTNEVSPVVLEQDISLSSQYSATGQSVTHTINLGTLSSVPQSFEIDLSNNYGTSGSITFNNPNVTFTPGSEPLKGTLTINNASVETFTIEVDSISAATGTLANPNSLSGELISSNLALINQTQEYNLSLSRTSGGQTGTFTSKLSVVDDGKDTLQNSIITTSSTGLGALESAIPTINEYTNETQASGTTQVNSLKSVVSKDGSTITFDISLKNETTTSQVMNISFGDDAGDYYDQLPIFTPDTIEYDAKNGQITIPPGVQNFSFTVETNDLAEANTNQTYTFSITDNAAPAGMQAITNSTKIVINDVEGEIAKSVYKDETQSIKANNAINLEVFDEDIIVSNGKLKAIIDNLVTDSGNNKFEEYKQSLDDFAKTFADITSSYIKNDDGSYIYGEIASDENIEIADDINLFSGSNVKTLSFNSLAVGRLEQKDYDYLATIQWKEDISFSGFGQGDSIVTNDSEATSFSEFYQNLRVNISRDKEDSDFLVDTQKTINESLNTTYDNLVKVDNDEEMINLIKFQAAYTANAKMITVVDEMLSTLLGIKR